LPKTEHTNRKEALFKAPLFCAAVLPFQMQEWILSARFKKLSLKGVAERSEINGFNNITPFLL